MIYFCDIVLVEYVLCDYWIGGIDVLWDGEFMWEGYFQSFIWINWGLGNFDRVGMLDCVIFF